MSGGNDTESVPEVADTIPEDGGEVEDSSLRLKVGTPAGHDGARPMSQHQSVRPTTKESTRGSAKKAPSPPKKKAEKPFPEPEAGQEIESLGSSNEIAQDLGALETVSNPEDGEQDDASPVENGGAQTDRPKLKKKLSGLTPRPPGTANSRRAKRRPIAETSRSQLRTAGSQASRSSKVAALFGEFVLRTKDGSAKSTNRFKHSLMETEMNNPGPGAYNVDRMNARFQGQAPSHMFPQGHRAMPSKVVSPGPAYLPRDLISSKRSGSKSFGFGTGARSRVENGTVTQFPVDTPNKTNPAGAAYEPLTSFGPRQHSTFKSAGKAHFGTGNRAAHSKIYVMKGLGDGSRSLGPGPASRSINQKEARIAGPSFGTAKRRGQIGVPNGVPGPGAYQAKRVLGLNRIQDSQDKSPSNYLFGVEKRGQQNQYVSKQLSRGLIHEFGPGPGAYSPRDVPSSPRFSFRGDSRAPLV